MSTMLGVFDEPTKLAAVVKRLRGRGYDDLETYAPAPFPEVDDAVIEKPSRVRIFTLVGGLAGVVTGYAMTIWMANNWQLIVGGKPFSSIPPYTVIAFELTILFGGLMTLLGLLAVGRMPTTKLDPVYDKRFSADDFGLVVRCRPRDVSELDALLREYGAVEVELVEP